MKHVQIDIRKPWTIPLLPIQVLQLTAIDEQGMVRASDLISQQATKDLVELGLIAYGRVWAQATYAGVRWLRIAEIHTLTDASS